VNIGGVTESGHEEHDIRLIALVTHDKSRDGLHNDTVIGRILLQTTLVLKLPGQGKGVDATGHIEPLVGPVLRDKLLVVQGQVEAEEDGRKKIDRIGTQRRVIGSGEPRRCRKDNSRDGLRIQTPDAMLIGRGKSRGAAGLNEEHDGHVAAGAPLAIQRLASRRRPGAGGNGSGHCHGYWLVVHGSPLPGLERCGLEC
jgi:hypothetical protein